jgi:abequosyltransferase
MYTLSFNIPTYNRSEYLEKNIIIIISQIMEFHYQNDIEINICDNCSTDSTKEIVNKLIDENPSIRICYCCNNKNIGPDLNFIKVMKMANNDFSILWGDDDFLKDGALKYIFEIINSNKASIYLSNRSNIDGKGNYLGEQYFLREDITERAFNFSIDDSAHAYFSFVKTLGGCLTFISSVIYKTSILEEIGEYDNRFTGTYYSFLNYWWRWLLKGNVLYYLNTSYLFCTTSGKLNSDTFGTGVGRSVVDFSAFYFISNILFENPILKRDFLETVFEDYPYYRLSKLYLNSPQSFSSELIPFLMKYGWSKNGIEQFVKNNSFINIFKMLVKKIVFFNK